MARREGNLYFFPDRIEAIAGDGINHRNKRLASRQTRVRLVDKVERCVVLKESLFSGRREFHELDLEQFGVVIGRDYAGRTVCAACPRAYHQRERETCAGDEFKNMLFHILVSFKLR